jgi:hypothetical protein
MAKWHARTASQMNDLVSLHGFTQAAVSQLRTDAGRWADMIGNERSKLFDLGNYQARVTVSNHEVTNVEVAV